jgi:hypothetical protein
MGKTGRSGLRARASDRQPERLVGSGVRFPRGAPSGADAPPRQSGNITGRDDMNYDMPISLEWKAEADWLEVLFLEQQAVFEAIGYEITTDMEAILY